MRKLYHFILCPYSRKVRIALKEKNLEFESIKENVKNDANSLEPERAFDEMLLLMDEDNRSISEHNSICEYLEDKYPDRSLLGQDLSQRAEVRRVTNLFDNKFYHHVVRTMIYEKIYKFITKKGAPNSSVIRDAKKNIYFYLDYIAYLTQNNQWLAGNQLSYADIAAASHLSILDYLGDVPWHANDEAKAWYALVKSRPSFRMVLIDRIPGFNPPPYYNDPDF